MTVKRAIAAWLFCGAGFALAIAGAPWPLLWIYLGVMGALYVTAPNRPVEGAPTKLPDVTAERVKAVRERTGCGMQEAKLAILQDDLQAAIQQARSVEEMRECLFGLLTLVRKRY